MFDFESFTPDKQEWGAAIADLEALYTRVEPGDRNKALLEVLDKARFDADFHAISAQAELDNPLGAIPVPKIVRFTPIKGGGVKAVEVTPDDTPKVSARDEAKAAATRYLAARHFLKNLNGEFDS